MAEELVQDQQNDAGKTEKKFNEALNKVAQILGGKDLLTPKKRVKGNVVTDIVEELTKERAEQNRAAVKAELGSLLTKYVELESEIKKKEEELKKLKETKQKEFIEASTKFLNKIEDVDSFAKQMADALNIAAGKA